MKNPKSPPHGGNIYHYAEMLGIPPGEILDFSASINPLGPSKMALKAIKAAMAELVNYPDPDSSALITALSDKFSLAADSMLAGNGSTELIYLIPRALRPSRALVLAPSFSDYARAVDLSGGKVVHFPLKEADGFVPDVDALVKAITGVDMLFLCNPNNPTGVLLDRDRVVYILTNARRAGSFVVLDEAFIEYAPGGSVIDEAVSKPGVAVLRNFTKFHGMPGLRAGWLAAHRSVISRIKARREPWSVNTLAERAAAASLSDTMYERKSLELFNRERVRLLNGLSGIPGFFVYATSANFLLIRVDTPGLTSGGLAERLAVKGILIRDCSNFKGLDGRFVRVAVRNRQDNERLVAAIGEAMNAGY